MAIIYHLTASDHWAAALALGSYTADSLTSEGFIHCSKAEQMVHTANHYYSGQHGLFLLAIDPARVAAEIRFENLSGGSELFPHIYGPLNLEAVRAVLPFEPEADGRFTHLPANAPLD
jgi:uncharacterized protein (DUF952 family)